MHVNNTKCERKGFVGYQTQRTSFIKLINALITSEPTALTCFLVFLSSNPRHYITLYYITFIGETNVIYKPKRAIFPLSYSS